MTDDHLVNNIRAVAGKELCFTFSRNPAKLNGSPYDLFFVQRIQIVEDPRDADSWKVSTRGYEYNIERRFDGQEVLAFHWEGHDASNSSPHLHIGFGGDCKQTSFSPKTHIPSGRVLIEDLVSFLIGELEVKPTEHRRSDWKAVLTKNKEAVMKFKSW